MKNSYLTRRFEETFKKNIEDLPLAYVWDRLAAFVVDFLIVSFLANIFLSPFKKKIQAAILSEHDGAINFYVFCIVFGASVIFILYHAISIYLFKKTIGKRVFGLEVAPIVHGQQFTIMTAFVRACGLFVSIILFFFPLLEVFSNRLRRPMHDRLSDTYVKGLTKTGASPSMVEKLWVRLVYVVVMANVAVVVAAQVMFFRQDIENLSEFVTQPEYLCDAVTDAKETWPKKEKVSRLDIALTLYGSDSVSEDCLDKEAQRAMSYGEELEKAYLAKAFIYEHDTKLSDKYLKKVCDLKETSDSCLLTQMITKWSEKDWKSANALLEKQKFHSPFMKVWAIKHYDKVQDYSELMSLADSMWPNKALNDFIGKYKTLTLWKLDKTSESKELFQSTYGYMPDSRKTSFLSDVCNLEIEKGCATNSFSGCKLLVDKMKTEVSESVSEETLLTYIKTNKCGMTDVDDIIAEFRVYIDDPKIQMYLAGVKAQSMGKNTVAEQIYKNILKAASSSSFLNYEARSNLIEMATEDNDIAAQLDWWLTTDSVSSYHQQLGMKYLKVLSEKKKWDMAEPIAQKLLSSSFKTKELSEVMAVVFYNLKKYNVAKKIIQSLEKSGERSAESTRDIASQDSFEQIKKELMKGNAE